jgi:hypothetical protein
MLNPATTETMLTALTQDEVETVQLMLQHYRDFQEELYRYPKDETTLFTKKQLAVFKLFDVTSITKHYD